MSGGKEGVAGGGGLRHMPAGEGRSSGSGAGRESGAPTLDGPATFGSSTKKAPPGKEERSGLGWQ